MDAERRKKILQQTLELLDYEIHACQQTLKFLQLENGSDANSSTILIKNQEQLCTQLQGQYDELVNQLAELG